MECERLTGRETKRDESEAEAKTKPKFKPKPKSKPKETHLGLTTTVALDTLHRDVRRILQEYEEDRRRTK